MHKNQNQRKINSTITSGKTKIVYTQYYFWQSQNIVLLRRARVSPSFCVRKNSPDRSFSERLSCSKNVKRFSLCDCLKRNTLGVFLFSTCRTNNVRTSALPHCRRISPHTISKNSKMRLPQSRNLNIKFNLTLLYKNIRNEYKIKSR